MLGKWIFMGMALSGAAIAAEKVSVIQFQKPDLKRNASLMEAFSQRASAIELSTTELKEKDLGDLLWAANGINRAESAKRTAPSALNAQDIDLYVVMKSGAYLYNAEKHNMTKVSEKDLRIQVAGAQTNMANAPVMLVLVSETARFPRGDEKAKERMGALDAGIVSQNISLFCAGTGLWTRARASMDEATLRKELKLNPTQIPLMNHPVSYPAK